MTVKLIEPTLKHKQLIKNLFVYYRYDLLPFLPEGSINSYGVMNQKKLYRHDDSIKDCDIWWDVPEMLFPFLIEAEGEAAGFTFISSDDYANPEVDYRINEFFVVNKFRQQKVGEQATSLLFEKMPGIWELGWLDSNIVAKKFWRKVIHSSAESYEDWIYREGKDSRGNEITLNGIKFTMKAKDAKAE